MKNSCTTKLEAPPGLDPDCQLFLGDPEKKTRTALNRIWGPAGGAIIGFGMALLTNYWYRRPVVSGIHKYVIHASIGGFAGEGLYRLRNRIYTEKDLQYYHYMTLHPEDFQAPEKVKFKDFLTFWVPIR